MTETSPPPFEIRVPQTEPHDESIARLEAQLEESRDARREERFVWILVCMILFDCFVFARMETSAGSLSILILQLLLLVVLAKRLGVDDVVIVLDKLMANLSSRKE